MENNKGWIKARREITRSWMWNDKPFSKAQAYWDLLFKCSFLNGLNFDFNGELVKLRRGELVTSEKRLMKSWGWSKAKVREFLKKLEDDGRISKMSDRKKTKIQVLEMVEDTTIKCEDTNIFKFFNENINPISPFQAEVLSNYLDDGVEPEMILAVLKDSVGKRDKWSWIQKVIDTSIVNGIKTLEKYEFEKKERKERKEATSTYRKEPDGGNVFFDMLGKDKNRNAESKKWEGIEV